MKSPSKLELAPSIRGKALHLGRKQLSALRSVLSRHGVTLCYLFGSSLDGRTDAMSDVDLGVVLKQYPDTRADLDLWSDLHDDLQPHFSPRHLDLVFLQRAPIVIQWSAINGKLLMAASDLARADFEEGVMRIWMDFRWWYDKQLEELAEAMDA